MKTLVVPIPGVLIGPLMVLAVGVGLMFVARAFLNGDREALARYGREIRKIAFWIVGFAALMVVLIGFR